MKCPNCGETSRIREKDKYCHKCGCNLRTGEFPTGSIFVPHELKTLEIDNENNIFKINGEDFAHRCEELVITFDGSERHIIVHTTNKIEFATYNRKGALKEHTIRPRY